MNGEIKIDNQIYWYDFDKLNFKLKLVNLDYSQNIKNAFGDDEIKFTTPYLLDSNDYRIFYISGSYSCNFYQDYSGQDAHLLFDVTSYCEFEELDPSTITKLQTLTFKGGILNSYFDKKRGVDIKHNNYEESDGVSKTILSFDMKKYSDYAKIGAFNMYSMSNKIIFSCMYNVIPNDSTIFGFSGSKMDIEFDDSKKIDFDAGTLLDYVQSVHKSFSIIYRVKNIKFDSIVFRNLKFGKNIKSGTFYMKYDNENAVVNRVVFDTTFILIPQLIKFFLKKKNYMIHFDNDSNHYQIYKIHRLFATFENAFQLYSFDKPVKKKIRQDKKKFIKFCEDNKANIDIDPDLFSRIINTINKIGPNFSNKISKILDDIQEKDILLEKAQIKDFISNITMFRNDITHGNDISVALTLDELMLFESLVIRMLLNQITTSEKKKTQFINAIYSYNMILSKV